MAFSSLNKILRRNLDCTIFATWDRHWSLCLMIYDYMLWYLTLSTTLIMIFKIEWSFFEDFFLSFGYHDVMESMFRSKIAKFKGQQHNHCCRFKSSFQKISCVPNPFLSCTWKCSTCSRCASHIVIEKCGVIVFENGCERTLVLLVFTVRPKQC